MSSHLETISAIYAAFGRGDVPFILSCLTEDVAWDDRAHHGIPLLQPRKGAAEVPAFFGTLQQAEFEQFEVKQLLAGGARVVALIEIKLLWKPTGRRFADDHAIHVWEFDGHGKVARFTHVEDTHAMWLATVAP